jgi:hypothetical protein
MRLRDRAKGINGAGWLRLYPRDWRDRYEPEMRAILEARPLDRRMRADLIRGALDARLHPRTPPPVPWIASIVGGAAWIVCGLASALQPTAPDWPGFLLETIPVGVVGAIATAVVVTAVDRRSGLEPPRGTDVALVMTLAAYGAWIAALLVAAIGGPYGAITGACQALAAIATVAVGLVRWSARDHPIGEIVLIAGAAMLLPTPLAWAISGGAWIALALTAVVPSLPPRRA